MYHFRMLRNGNVLGLGVFVYVLAVLFAGTGQAQQQSKGGWNIPPNAADEKNPLTPDQATVAAGK